MTKATEEMLMALADGELDRDAAAEILRAAEADPALAARLRDMQRTRRVAKAAFADVLEERIPERLIAAAGGARPASAEGGLLVRLRKFWLPAAVALAGSAAGFAIAFAIVADPSGPPPLLAGGASLDAALDRTRSGEVVAIERGRSIQPAATYVVADGVCRTFHLSDDRARSSEAWLGVACRHDGHWQVELAVAERATEGGFVPASDGAVASVDTFLDSAGAGATLEPEAEAKLLENGWRVDAE